MKVLITAAYNTRRFSPFIIEQAKSLQKLGVQIEFFGIEGKGLLGYLKNRKNLIPKIKEFQPHIIHAHYGLSGLLANLQRKVPVITTYHGSDINNSKILRFSKIAMRLSVYNIFVSQKNINTSGIKKRFELIPCGVDVDLFKPTDDRLEAKKQMNLDILKKHVLFAGAFDNQVKNVVLAKEAISQLNEVELLELKGYSREQVMLLMNAADVVLMTSFTEGSPQFIKEAMLCNCPIVSVDVGDVKEIFGDTQGCYLSEQRTPEDVAEKLQQAIAFGKRTNGRERILDLGLDINTVAQKVLAVYKAMTKID